MMGVYIKGMEMPESCWDCRYICGFWHPNKYKTDRPTECPLVPVPPHGRLIDADALITDNAGKWTVYDLQRFFNAPTIIPAEEGET